LTRFEQEAKTMRDPARTLWCRGAESRTMARTLVFVIGTALGVLTVRAQEPPVAVPAASGLNTQNAPGHAIVTVPPGAPGSAVAAPAELGPGAPLVPPEVQVVRFQGPPGLGVEVLAPAPVPVPIGDGQGILTTGLTRGIGYRLRLTNLPERPGAELFPLIEVVGHLHRPENIDPGKYPIRVVFNDDDLSDVLDRGRLVTKIIYLEDPDQAVPIRVAKDQVSVLSLNPTESPLRVAAALGRPMAIVRIGSRQPSAEELSRGAAGDLGLDWAESLGNAACPYLLPGGAHCSLPCGPVCAAPPRPARPGLPRDEFLCDGGDRGTPAAPSQSGHISGVEPRDAVVRFDINLRDRSVTRVLPTNVVCVYAPRFAEVRTSAGANENIYVKSLHVGIMVQEPELSGTATPARRLVQNQAAELARNRARAAGYKGREQLDEASNNRGAAGYENALHVAIDQQQQKPEVARNRLKPGLMREQRRAIGIKTVEGPVVTGIVEGASEAVKVWEPHDVTGVETPPNRPGLAVVKLVSPFEAQPGDTLTYVIMYRNMGNSPIRSLVIVDSLLPRLEYQPGTSKGPEDTVFTTAENRAGATELRWALPGALAPGVTGHVSFQAIVR
jgi:uncharacterized repeat protein (TIGR01451 family)